MFIKKYLSFYNILRLILLFILFFSIFTGNYLFFIISFLTLIATLLPYRTIKNNKIDFPIEIEISLILFIILSVFLGEFINFYEIFWWWDILLHFLSGIIFSFLWFLIVYVLYIKKEIKSSLFIILFSFSITLAIGVLWEIFEFFMDTIFGGDMVKKMQLEGISDTMIDLIANTIGALMVSITGYFYIKEKGKKRGIFSFLLERVFNKKFKKYFHIKK